MKPDKKIQSLGTILQDLFNPGGMSLDPLVPRVIELWSELIPDSLRPYTCLEGLREGTLQVLVSNPAAAQQFQFLKESLRLEINRRLDQTVVAEIRLKTGLLPPQDPNRAAPKEKELLPPRSLSRKEKETIRQVSQEIKNPELRARIQTLMEKNLRFNTPAARGPRASKPRGARKPPKPAGP